MSAKKLAAMIEDEDEIRVLAKKFLKTGDYERLERYYDWEEGTFDSLFGRSKEMEMRFQQAVLDESENERTLKSSYQVGKSIDRLFNITEDPEEDARLVNQAAAIILNYYSKRDAQKTKKGEDDDDLFVGLYEELKKEKNGKSQESSSETMS